jgi:hypothetical protein
MCLCRFGRALVHLFFGIVLRYTKHFTFMGRFNDSG